MFPGRYWGELWCVPNKSRGLSGAALVIGEHRKAVGRQYLCDHQLALSDRLRPDQHKARYRAALPEKPRLRKHTPRLGTDRIDIGRETRLRSQQQQAG